MSEMLNAAVAYALRGWHVFPVRPRDKTPLTAHGVKDATDDVDQIAEWWERWPDANIGLACGPSGLVVIDVDAGKGGYDAWSDLQLRLGLDDETVTSQTGGGGLHYLFRAPEGVTIRNSAGKLGPGLDVRADGGYIVLPPSVHPSGQRYEWAPGLSPDDLDPKPLPDVLARLLANDQRPRETPPGDGKIPKGRRNTALTSIAGSLLRRGLSAETIEAALQVINRQQCAPPLPDDEVRRIAQSIGRYAPPNGQREPATPLIRRGADFAKSAGEVNWLWRGWLARGTVTVLAGMQGVGKTTLALALGALLTRGGKWGDGTDAPRGRVLYVPAEGTDSEIGDKLWRTGADDVDVLTAGGGAYLTVVNDYDTILSAAAGYDVIVLDSLTGHALSDLRKSEVARAFMNKLGELARITGAAVLVLHHLRKRTILDLGEGVNQDRVRDSQDILAVARMAWGLEEAEDGSLTLSVIKTNLAAKPPALKLVVDDDGIIFLGTLEERTLEPTSGWERAAAWLKDVLKDGPKEPREVQLLASAAGITPKQLRLAREKVVGGFKRLANGRALWALTPEDIARYEQHAQGHVGHEGHEGGNLPNMPNMPLITTCPGQEAGHEGNGRLPECPDCGRPFTPEEARLTTCPDCGARLSPAHGNGHGMTHQPAPAVVKVGEACAGCGQPVRYTDATAEGYPGWLRGECGCGGRGIRYVKRDGVAGGAHG